MKTNTSSDSSTKFNLYAKELNNLLFHTYNSYYNYKHLFLSRIREVAGSEEAEKNVRIFNLFKNFFIPTERAHLHQFILGITKFFDDKNNRNKKTLSVHKMTGTARGLGLDVKKNERLMEKHKKSLSKLFQARDKFIAHKELTDLKHSIPGFEALEDLLNDMAKLVNDLTQQKNSNLTAYQHLEEEIKSDLNRMFKDLIEYDQIKRDQILKPNQ